MHFRDIFLSFGGEKLMYRVEIWHGGYSQEVLPYIFRFFYFENCGFCSHFSKKVEFLKFLGVKKQKKMKIRDIHFMEFVISCILSFLFFC